MTTYHLLELPLGRMLFTSHDDRMPANFIRHETKVFPDREAVISQAAILAQRGWHVTVDDEHGTYETDRDPVNKLGTWADYPCWYATVMDGPKCALLLGPFRTEAACRQYAYLEPADGGDRAKHLAMINKANELDAKAAFYSFGMTKMHAGYTEGILNRHLQLANSEYYGTLGETIELSEYDFRCICKNTSHSQGAYPCDSHGNEVEPPPNHDEPQTWCCDNCGRIWDETGKVVSTREIGYTTF